MISKENMYDNKYRLYKFQGYDSLPREEVLKLMDEYLNEHLTYSCEEGIKWGIGHWCTICNISEKCEFMKDEKKRIDLELQLDSLKT